MEILSIKTCGIDQRKYYFDTYWLAGMDILSSRMWTSPTLFRDTESEGVPHLLTRWYWNWSPGFRWSQKKKCLFPVGGHCRMHSLYWLDFSDFRQETHFQHRLDQFWNPLSWGSNLVFKTTFCPKPWRFPNRGLWFWWETFGWVEIPNRGDSPVTQLIPPHEILVQCEHIGFGPIWTQWQKPCLLFLPLELLSICL